MNGPRTYQFDAPTSFITSISRRLEKIERRIVFAIRSVEAISSTITAIRKISSMTFPTFSTRFEVSPPFLTLSTPGGRGFRSVREMVDKMRKRVIALDGGRLARDERRGGYTVE